jgi:Zn-dependent protease
MDMAGIMRTISVFLIPALFAITLHEVAHGWAARQLGDRTAEMLGRLTINPLKHIDPIGTVVVPLAALLFTNFLFGWAKPVPVAFGNLRNPRRDMVLVAAAGPAANLVMATAWAGIWGILEATVGIQGNATLWVASMCQIGVLFNVVLAVFNLLPIPPLDGGRVVAGLLPPNLARSFVRIEPFGVMIVLLLLVTGVLWPLMSPVLSALNNFFLSLAGVGGR